MSRTPGARDPLVAAPVPVLPAASATALADGPDLTAPAVTVPGIPGSADPEPATPGPAIPAPAIPAPVNHGPVNHGPASPAPAVPGLPGLPGRAVVRRTAKVLVCCLLGYGVLWACSAGGMPALTAWARQDASGGRRTAAGINHFLRVDAKVWRGSAPTAADYREVAREGIRTVVDLRVEDLSARELALPAQAGLTAVRLPIRDGQTPTERQVGDFLRVVRRSDGPVYVHCGAGVGRTGAMTAAYLVRTGQATSKQAALRTVAVGPPSIEQVYHVLTARRHDSDQPPVLVSAISRLLDAPRRIKASL